MKFDEASSWQPHPSLRDEVDSCFDNFPDALLCDKPNGTPRVMYLWLYLDVSVRVSLL